MNTEEDKQKEAVEERVHGSEATHVKKDLSMYFTPVAIIIAGIIIGLGVYFGSMAGGGGDVAALPAGQAGNPPAPEVHIEDVDLAGDPYIGQKDAPVVMAYWSDYQCPFCHKFEMQTMPQIVENYVKTGKVRIVFQDYQFLGPDSLAAAVVARAVWEVAPDQFYDWFRAVYKHQDGENSGWGAREDVLAVTKDVLGASKADTVAQLSKEKEAEYKKAIQADRAEGSKFGIRGTPGMIIGDQLVVGAQAYFTVKQAIEAELNEE